MRLIHTMLRVVDLERAIQFYTQVMEMQVLRREDFPDGRFTLAFIGYGNEQDQPVIELTHNWDTNSYAKGDAYGHIAIQCDDLEATCERIRSSEGELISEPHKMQGGPVMAFASDPEGYVIELLDADVFDRPMD
jgi:lactoylglutathione lyase